MELFVFASWPLKKNSTFNLVLEINIKQTKEIIKNILVSTLLYKFE
jgi:hypothetical protein